MAESKRCASFGRGLSETCSPRRGHVPRLRARDELQLLAADLGDAEHVRVGAELLDDLDAGRHAVLPDLERFRPQAEDEVAAPVRACDSGERIVDRDVGRTERDRAVRPQLDRAEVHRRGADEAGDEGVRRPVVQLARRPALLQLPVAEHGDPVPERHRLRLVVCHVDRRHAELELQRCDVGAHLDAQLRVEVRERLVHQEHARHADDRAPHRDALALAAGQLAGLPLEVVLEPEHLRHVAHALVAHLLLDLRDLQREPDVLRHGHVRVERVVLEDHRDVAVLRRDVGDVALADVDRSGVDLLEAGEHAERGRLARARWADEDHELAVRDVEVERVDCGRVAAGVDPRRLQEPDVSHRRPFPARSPRPRRRAHVGPAPAPGRRRRARRGRGARLRRSAATRCYGR